MSPIDFFVIRPHSSHFGDENNDGMSTCVDNPAFKNNASENVEAITVDKYVNSNNIKQVDLVKIDVEGFEYRVLNGMKNTIQKYNPTIFVEHNFKALSMDNRSSGDLVIFLKDLGCSAHDIKSGSVENYMEGYRSLVLYKK